MMKSWPQPADIAGQRVRRMVRIGSKPHVRVHENQQRVAGTLGEDMAGVLLAAPVGRKRRGEFETDVRIARGELGDNRGGAVRGMVVDHDDFKIDIAIGENRF